MLKPQGLIRLAINESVLGQTTILGRMGLAPRSPRDLYDAVRAGYNEAGLRTLWVEAVKDGDGCDHGG